jgi:small subunit ribosomal protein S2
MRKVSLKDLLEAGAHFGHKTSRWNPAAKKYIYGERNNIHIIDLVKTKDQLEKAAKKLNEIGSEDGGFLLVGAKRQIGSVVRDIAEEAGVHYMTTRWVGGMITNWEEVKKRIDLYNEMGEEKKKGVWAKLVKHERVKKDQDREKLRRVYGGVVTMTELPKCILWIQRGKRPLFARQVGRELCQSVFPIQTRIPEWLILLYRLMMTRPVLYNILRSTWLTRIWKGRRRRKKLKKARRKAKTRRRGNNNNCYD